MFLDCHQCPLNDMRSSLGDSSREPIHRHGKEHRRLDASLFDTGVHPERFCLLIFVYDSAFNFLVRDLEDVHQSMWGFMVP